MTENFDSLAATWDSDPRRSRRARTIAGTLTEQLPPMPDHKALEIGCGTGTLGILMMDHFQTVHFSDTSPAMLEEVKKKTAGSDKKPEIFPLDLTAFHLPVQYGCIFTSMTMHHIAPLDSAIRSLSSRLLSHGYLAIADLDIEDGSYHAGSEAIPHKGIDRQYLKNLMIKSGMTIHHESTPYIETKTVCGIKREYPLFLIIGQKKP